MATRTASRVPDVTTLEQSSCESRLRNLQYRHQHHLQSQICLCHTCASREKRSAEAANLKERDEQGKVSARSRPATRSTAPTSTPQPTQPRLVNWPKRRRNEQDGHVPRVTSERRPAPRSASHHSRATSQMIPSAPLGSAREAQTARSSAALHCTASRYGSRQTCGTPQPRYESHPASCCQSRQRTVGMPSSSTSPSIGTRPGPTNRTDPRWRSRNPGLVRKAHRVIPADATFSSCCESISTSASRSSVFVTCTAGPHSQLFFVRAKSTSAHVDDGCIVGPQPTLHCVSSASETMCPIKRSGPVDGWTASSNLGRYKSNAQHVASPSNTTTSLSHLSVPSATSTTSTFPRHQSSKTTEMTLAHF